ncbi:MAG: magnesium/cobalt transporter CorA [Spirochaetales bacterium]|nr:magnesium/cobalt transporter CorA [Spirochaetales bacterium]
MSKFSKNQPVGLPPGTLLQPETDEHTEFKITVVNYDSSIHNKSHTTDIDAAIKSVELYNNTWIHIEGINNASIIEKIGAFFDIHPLVMEDMLTPQQRPKIENHRSYLFVVAKTCCYVDESAAVQEEQISMIVGKNYVISVQNSNIDHFSQIWNRLENDLGIVRDKGMDYLMYCLLDIITDNYFVLIDKLNEKIETIEDELILNPKKETLNTIYTLKNEILFIQRPVWPLRDIIYNIKSLKTDIIDESNFIYFNDVSDHVIQVFEAIRSFREMAANMFDLYLSSHSHKMNEVMKFLTVIGTIFIPLTFITGVYGMNFKVMPELGFDWAYPVLWGILIAIGVFMVLFFKRKKWM